MAQDTQAVAVERLWIQFAENGNIRKFQHEAFAEGTEYVPAQQWYASNRAWHKAADTIASLRAEVEQISKSEQLTFDMTARLLRERNEAREIATQMAADYERDAESRLSAQEGQAVAYRYRWAENEAWLVSERKPTSAPLVEPLFTHPATVQPAGDVEAAEPRCLDCAEPYGSPRFPDLVLPNDVWNKLMPDGGLLCPNCLCARAEKAGITCEATFRSGPFTASRHLPVGEGWRPIESAPKDGTHILAVLHREACEDMDGVRQPAFSEIREIFYQPYTQFGMFLPWHAGDPFDSHEGLAPEHMGEAIPIKWMPLPSNGEEGR